MNYETEIHIAIQQYSRQYASHDGVYKKSTHRVPAMRYWYWYLVKIVFTLSALPSRIADNTLGIGVGNFFQVEKLERDHRASSSRT